MGLKRAIASDTQRRSKKRKETPAVGSTEENDTNQIQTVKRPHSASLHTIKDPQNLRKELLCWFETVRNVRGMPWRKPFCDNYEEQSQRAYEVWVSEIMLQQTQVATVIPYYNRWLEKFPTIYDLAKADIDTVNNIWKGLGYYSRASRLLAGAKIAVEKFDGRLPDDAKLLEKEIPGIGRYSAGAICSIAFGRCVPVLDGNVHRLLSRVLAVHSSPKARKTLDLLWKAAEDMVSGCNNPGDVNQALIELGSTVCKVKEPICETCPLKSGCGAYAEYTIGLATVRAEADIEDLCQICEPVPPGNAVIRFPMKAAKTKSRFETDLVNLIEWRGNGERHFVLVRRPEKGLLAGLYEFPSCEAIDINNDDNETDLLERSRLILENLFGDSISINKNPKKKQASTNGVMDNLRVTDMRCVGEHVHVFSHIRKTYRILSVVLQGGPSPPTFFKDQKNNTGVESIGMRAKWVLEKGVAGANVGTGVLNIWKKACSYWATTGDEGDDGLL